MVADQLEHEDQLSLLAPHDAGWHSIAERALIDAPVDSPVAAAKLTGGRDLRPGGMLPSDGPAFHVWHVDESSGAW